MGLYGGVSIGTPKRNSTIKDCKIISRLDELRKSSKKDMELRCEEVDGFLHLIKIPEFLISEIKIRTKAIREI